MSFFRSAWQFIVDVALRWYHGSIGDLAAMVTFWVLISLPAFVLTLLSVLGPLDDVLDFGFQTEIRENVIEFIGDIFSDSSGDIREAIDGLFDQTNPGLFTISLGFALWSISRGFAGLIRALEEAYDVEDGRPWYTTRVVAIFLGIGTMIIPLPLLVLEQILWTDIESNLLATFGRYTTIGITLVGWASIIYYFGPAERNRWRDDLPGAVVASILWTLLVFVISDFIGIISGGNEVTAVVGAGLIALTWIWLAAQALLIGGAVNYLAGARRGIVRKKAEWNLTGEIKKVIVDN